MQCNSSLVKIPWFRPRIRGGEYHRRTLGPSQSWVWDWWGPIERPCPHSTVVRLTMKRPTYLSLSVLLLPWSTKKQWDGVFCDFQSPPLIIFWKSILLQCCVGVSDINDSQRERRPWLKWIEISIFELQFSLFIWSRITDTCSVKCILLAIAVISLFVLTCTVCIAYSGEYSWG